MTKAKSSEAKETNQAGDLIRRQKPEGKIIVSLAPGQQTFLKGGKDHQERLRKAASYARFAARAQPIYAELAKESTKTAYNLALSDWFSPPTIHEVQRREDKILVRASDDVVVTKVVITCLDQQGKLVEAGEADRQADDWWEYIPHPRGKTFIIEAWDLAGNVTKFVL